MNADLYILKEMKTQIKIKHNTIKKKVKRDAECGSGAT